jgi:hypothetical protein
MVTPRPAAEYCRRSRPDKRFSPRFLHIVLTVRLFLFGILLHSGKVTRMTEEKTARELVYDSGWRPGARRLRGGGQGRRGGSRL